MIPVLLSVLLSASGASAAPFPDPFTFHNGPAEIKTPVSGRKFKKVVAY
jgi:hypothetical protein